MAKLSLIKKVDLGFKYVDGVENIWLTGGYVMSPVFTMNDRCAKTWEANRSEEWRRNIVTSIAAISRGKAASKNPNKRYEMLLKEAVNNPEKIDADHIESVAGRPLEFVPVVLRYKYYNNNVWLLPLTLDKDKKIEDQIIHGFTMGDFNNDILRFSYTSKRDISSDTYILKTNLRALLNAGVEYDKIPYMKEDEEEYYKDYKTVVIQAPHFVFDQLYTHSVFSKIAVSERVTSEDDYYLPDDILDRIYKAATEWTPEEIENDYIYHVYGNSIHELKKKGEWNDENKRKLLIDLIQDFLTEFSHNDVVSYLEELGYKQELYNRWSYGLKYKTFILSGWKTDPKVWNHLLVERQAYPELYKSWVQKETATVASKIRELFENEEGETNE